LEVALQALAAVLLLALLGGTVLPFFTDSADDRGDGRTDVIIPRHVRTPPRRPRTWVFLALVATLGLVFLGWQHPSLPGLYAHAVNSAAVALTHSPAMVNAYVARLRPASVFFAVAYISGIALVIRASPARRVAALAHALLYLALMLLTHVSLITVGIATRMPAAPFSVEATLANLFVGGLVIMRLTFTSFVLPRSTTVPVSRHRSGWDSILAACALITVIATMIAGYAFISDRSTLTATWRNFLPIYTLSLLFVLIFAPLWALWWTNRRLPSPGPDRPPVDVIVPAYNEEENITRLLRSVDLAAARYGGPVRVMVSNDGSVDNTAQVALRAIARMRHARGEVISAPNAGQATALNRGLAIAEAEIIIRIDADCVMGRRALEYSVPWFRDPDIGSVGAMEEPRTDTVTWFHRLRALETLFQFRFARLGQSMVDGIVVIPGTFTAFRLGPAKAAGGFPIGMNGEDADLTMQIGRLGYRVVVDPRIRSYEDVPRSAGEFVEQRTRWARGGFHVFARHLPFRCGSAGPRVWFWTLRRGFSWFSAEAGLVAPIFLVELVLTHPGYRHSVAILALLYVLGGTLPLAISLPLAIKYGYWRSILWAPTWFAYAFLRRLATLEAIISLPTRPFPAVTPSRSPGASPRTQTRPLSVVTDPGRDWMHVPDDDDY